MKSLYDQLVELIEANTRFDVSSIKVLEESRFDLVPLLVLQHQKISFEVKSSKVPGKLPRDVVYSKNIDKDLASEFDRLKKVTRKALKQVSAEKEYHSYGRFMPVETFNLFTHFTSFGRSATCTACSGAGSCTCTSCSGKGNVVCSRCAGDGSVSCSTCSGTSHVRCHACNNGSLVLPQAFDGRGGVQGCDQCGGTGRRMCIQCNFGKTMCPTCGVRGEVTCSTCNGLKKHTCSICNGAKEISEIFEIKPNVHNSMYILKPTKNPLVPEHLEAITKIKLKDIPSFSEGPPEVLEAYTDIEGYGVDFKFNLITHKLKVLVNGKEYVIFGFGNELKIIDFQNILDDLLKEDFSSFNESLSGFAYLKSKKSLRKAIYNFCGSEANEQIAEEWVEGISPKNSKVAGVSDLYIADVRNSLNKASDLLSVLTYRNLIPAFVVLSGILSFAALMAATYFELNRDSLRVYYDFAIYKYFLPVVGALTILMLLIDFNSFSRAGKLFSRSKSKNFAAKLLKSNTTNAARLIGVGAMLVAGFIGASMASKSDVASEIAYSHNAVLNAMNPTMGLRHLNFNAYDALEREIDEGNTKAVLFKELLRLYGKKPMTNAELNSMLTSLDAMPESIKKTADWYGVKAVVLFQLNNASSEAKKLFTQYTNNSGSLATSDIFYAAALNAQALKDKKAYGQYIMRTSFDNLDSALARFEYDFDYGPKLFASYYTTNLARIEKSKHLYPNFDTVKKKVEARLALEAKK